MSTLRAVVVDDEPHARRLLRSLLEREPGVEVVGESGRASQAVAETRRARPDVLFLDIQLPNRDGFQVLEELAQDGTALPAVVFVTAYDSFALQAFEVHAVDYLLKPFDEERLRHTLNRVRVRLAASDIEGMREELARLVDSLEKRPLRRIAVRDGEESAVLQIGSVDWLEAVENYVRVHCAAKAYLVRATLRSLEDRLDPEVFVRIHRGTIVNADRIRRLVPWSHGDLRVELEDGTTLKASRRYRARLDRVLKMLR